MTTRFAAVAVIMLVAFAGCSRSPEGLAPTAPGDDDRLGTVSATWQATPDERGFKNAARLDEPEVRFRYRVDVHNGTDDKLFVRLDRFALLDEAGLAGDVWVRKRDAERVKSFGVRRFAAALDDDGRAQYRAWLLAGRPGDAAAIEQEITRQAATKPCAG